MKYIIIDLWLDQINVMEIIILLIIQLVEYVFQIKKAVNLRVFNEKY